MYQAQDTRAAAPAIRCRALPLMPLVAPCRCTVSPWRPSRASIGGRGTDGRRQRLGGGSMVVEEFGAVETEDPHVRRMVVAPAPCGPGLQLAVAPPRAAGGGVPVPRAEVVSKADCFGGSARASPSRQSRASWWADAGSGERKRRAARTGEAVGGDVDGGPSRAPFASAPTTAA